MSRTKSSAKRIYLDHNATTPLDPLVLEAMLPYLREIFGNPSSIHSEGRAARVAVDKARSQLANFLGAKEDEIYFTSGGTESNNLAIRGAAEVCGKAGQRLVTSAVEHHAVLRPMQNLAGHGFVLDILRVDRYGRVNPEDLDQSLASGQAALVSIIAANNEVGTIQPVCELGAICRKHGVLFHVDAVQAAGKIPLDLSALPVDLLSVSGHKLYGPKGAGALYVRKGVKLEPLILGGSHERRLRAGTENVAGIVGLGAACELAGKETGEQNKLLSALRDRLWDRLRAMIEGIHLNGHPAERLSNTLNVSFEGVEGEALLLNLDLKGIAASSGSACASGSLEPSHVLTAMGVPAELAQNSVRFSLGRGNTEKEMDRTAEAAAEIVARLRSL
ncbi:MAG TPA: cysteine desulfurase family protein [archaeon]|nr:cysteine desulfurase family protein [archaeon]